MYKIQLAEDPREPKQREELLTETIRSFSVFEEGAAIEIRRTEKGKPYLFDVQLEGPSEKIHFSVSHSGSLWACVVSDRVCGLDVQELRPASFEALAVRYYSSREADYVKSAGLKGFYEIWIRREALAKYTGLGFFGMSDKRPELVNAEGVPAAEVQWNGCRVIFEEISVPEGYLAVWCHGEE